MGFAYQTDSQFCREVIQSLERAAARYGVHLVTVNNRYSSREALHNADLLIREAVDLVFEFQPYEQIAPMISSKFSAAGIPVIAVELPHPGAMFYGANNYQAGIIGGRALGKWTRTHWHGSAEELVLLELPIAGKLPSVRMKGMADGLRTELPDFDSLPVMHLDGKGDFQRVFTVMKRFFNQRRPKKTLVCAVNDICALAAIRAVEEIGGDDLCAVVGQNAIPEARQELRRPGTRLIGSVAFFPERYGDELIPLALAVLQNRPVPAASFVKHQLITSKNVDLAYPLDTQTCQEHVCGAKS
jgi:ribose transport system substrate-binding protein